MENAEARYEEAQAQTKAAKAELDLLLAGATEDTIKAARARVEQAAGVLMAAREELTYARITAPEDGVVTEKFRNKGELVSIGTPIVRIADLEDAWVRVYAPLSSLGLIQIGQPVKVTTDTYGNRVYRGTVMSVADDPEFTPKNVQTQEERVKLVYAVRVDVDNRSRTLKPGMPADAAIKVEP